MNINVTITSEDVEEAIKHWFMAKPEFQLCKNNRIDISWKGGSTYILTQDALDAIEEKESKENN